MTWFGVFEDSVGVLKEDGISIPGVTPFLKPDEGAPAAEESSPSCLDQAEEALMEAVATATVQLETVLDAYATIFGSVDWLSGGQPDTEGQWLGQFLVDTGDTPDDSIDAADEAQLLATTLPDSVTQADAQEFIDRWNRTVTYAAEGITTASQVPAGQSTDFIDQGVLANIVQCANSACLASEADGYSDPAAELQAAVNQFIDSASDDSVCARSSSRSTRPSR